MVSVSAISIPTDQKRSVKTELLSGLTVALALVPEAVAFSFVAGLPPQVGLWSAFFVGFIASLLGGRPAMISGATGALAVVVAPMVAGFVDLHGPVEGLGIAKEHLLAAVVLMGLLQVVAGFLQVGKLMRLVPYPVMLGFVNGLAIVIFLAQIDQFKDPQTQEWLSGQALWIFLGLLVLTMGVMAFLPKLTKAVPSGLVAIVAATLVAVLAGLDVTTVGDLVPGGIAGSIPTPALPMLDFTGESWKIIVSLAVSLAAIGLIESLMTLQLVDEMTLTRGNSDREAAGQGIGNIVCGVFGGMGGCAMIGQTVINVASGGRGRLSGAGAAVILLAFMFLIPDLIEMIPIAALVGVMFMVVIGTFAWSSMRILNKIPKSDAFVIVLVALVTVLTDLAIAVACGVIASALVFAWQKSTGIFCRVAVEKDGFKYYYLRGPLFFGSVQSFNDHFTVKEDTDRVYVDFSESRVCDHSAIEAINGLVTKYERAGKELIVKGLNPSCVSVIKKAGPSIFRSRILSQSGRLRRLMDM